MAHVVPWHQREKPATVPTAVPTDDEAARKYDSFSPIQLALDASNPDLNLHHPGRCSLSRSRSSTHERSARRFPWLPTTCRPCKSYLRIFCSHYRRLRPHLWIRQNHSGFACDHPADVASYSTPRGETHNPHDLVRTSKVVGLEYDGDSPHLLCSMRLFADLANIFAVELLRALSSGFKNYLSLAFPTVAWQVVAE